MVRCTNCDTEHDHPDDLDHEEVDELLVEEGETPKMQIGTGQRDVWRCKGCGKVLGVR